MFLKQAVCQLVLGFLLSVSILAGDGEAGQVDLFIWIKDY
jgi:hypothetical protein